jgi:CMP-N-acetylneuraminic acid synthetase
MTTVNTNILCIIPARKGSKGIPNKNIKMYNEKPLIYWSIKCALNSKYYNNHLNNDTNNNINMRVIVSTDDEEYQHIAIQCGAECQFLRPIEYSCDLSPDIDFMQYTTKTLKETEDYTADIIVQLRPTYPNRSFELLDTCIETFINKRDKYDSLRTVVKMEKSPYKMYNIINDDDDEKKRLKPLFNEVEGIKEPYNQCRQILPQVYLHNGCIDILNTNILKDNTVSGNYIYPFVMKSDETHDIDDVNDWNKSLLVSEIL